MTKTILDEQQRTAQYCGILYILESNPLHEIPLVQDSVQFGFEIFQIVTVYIVFDTSEKTSRAKIQQAKPLHARREILVF